MDCENRFDLPDQYAINLLLKSQPDEKILVGENKFDLIYKSYNYDLFLDFCISLLIRAQASKRPFYSAVYLGPYFKELVSYFFTNSKFDLERIQLFITATLEPEFHELMEPVAKNVKMKPLTYYQFWVGRFQIYIKIGKTKLPNHNWILKKGKPLRILEIQRANRIMRHAKRLGFFD